MAASAATPTSTRTPGNVSASASFRALAHCRDTAEGVQKAFLRAMRGATKEGDRAALKEGVMVHAGHVRDLEAVVGSVPSPSARDSSSPDDTSLKQLLGEVWMTQDKMLSAYAFAFALLEGSDHRPMLMRHRQDLDRTHDWVEQRMGGAPNLRNTWPTTGSAALPSPQPLDVPPGKLTKNVIDELTKLYRTEIAAASTYAIAKSDLDDDEVAWLLTRLEADHRGRATVIASTLRANDVAIPGDETPWVLFRNMLQSGAMWLGDSAALAALEEGESLGVQTYARATCAPEPFLADWVKTMLLPLQLNSERRVHAMRRYLRNKVRPETA